MEGRAGHEDGRRYDERFARQLSFCDAGFIPYQTGSSALEQVAARYAVALPPALAALIDRNDPRDPIARQFVPDAAELEQTRRGACRSDRR